MEKKFKAKSILVFICLMFLLVGTAAAQRDWEFWTQETFSFPVKDKVNLLILPEWKTKYDMRNIYLFKLENGLSFKINKNLDIIAFYAFQEKKSAGIYDRSDLAYLDTALKFKSLFDTDISNRVRYQYDFDKAKTTLRNAFKLSRALKLGKLEISPFISEEPFYDCKLDRITEHRSASGVSYKITKNTSLTSAYMLNSKRGKDKWGYTNVLLMNLSVKF